LTYSQASEWANRHIPKDGFDSFDEWLEYATSEAYNGLRTPELLSAPEYVNIMHDNWMSEIGVEDRRDIEAEPEPDVLPTPREIQITKGIVITPSGAQPVKVLSSPIGAPIVLPRDTPQIRITESKSTAQRISILQRVKSGITSFFGRFRRKR
jgi:hypothetical protein